MSRKIIIKKSNKSTKPMRIAGYLFSAIQGIASVIFMILLHFSNLIPNLYKGLIDVVLVLLCVLTVITQRWKIAGIATKLLSVLLSVVLVMGNIYLYKTYAALSSISGETGMTTQVGVYVLKTGTVREIEQLCNGKLGSLQTPDSSGTQQMVEHLQQEKGFQGECIAYTDMLELVDALYSGAVDGIVLGVGFAGMLEDTEGYSDFADKTLMIYSKDFVSEVEGLPSDGDSSQDNPYADVLNGGDTITFYISGIDQYGPPTTVSRSDVNILCVINKTTHQVLLINTPRDYYVPLPNSNGVRDKLTHAGNYGVTCSMGTLEALYGIKADYYIKVNFTGFISIIDAIGGIDVYSEYEFTTIHGGYHYVKGMNHLSGIEALGFARERYNLAGGDRQRGRDHMLIIEALIKKLASPALLANYTAVLDSLEESMVTGMPYDDISALIRFQIDEMPAWDIVQYSVDGVGEYHTTFSLNRELYVMIPDMATVEKAREYLKTIYSDRTVDLE